MNRRRLLKGTLGLSVAGLAMPAKAAQLADLTVTSAIRGSINAEEFRVWPGALDDQSRAFARMLDKAAESDAPVFLPPGDYVVSNIRLPRRTRLVGVPGASRIVYGGGGYLFAAEDADLVDLAGLIIDGANRPIGGEAQALVEMRRVASFAMDRCEVAGSGKSGVALERTSGRIERSIITGAADTGVYAVESGSLLVTGNTVSDCGDGGILVHRWQPGDDGAIVTHNRVERIAASSGGTGQFGNGINVFRADNVIVSNNHVSGCAFSAVRANSASNIQIVANQCLGSGETAIYSEFAFEGAVINSNIVDGAAIGISIANFNEGGRMAVCNGNLVRNLVDHAPYEAFEAIGFGIGISVEADTAVSGNVVEGAPLFGMMFGWGEFLRNVVATGNVVRETPTGFAVSVIEGAGSAVISDNIIEGAASGIVGYRWGDAVTGDLANEGSGEFRHLTIERNLVS